MGGGASGGFGQFKPHAFPVQINGNGVINQDQYLVTGGVLKSSDGQYTLIMQNDGNLVGYNSNQIGSGAWWASNTAGKGNNLIAQMQNDGNLVIYPGNSTGGPPSITPFSGALWASGSAGKGWPPYRLAMQTDRNIVVYDSRNTPIWASGTNVAPPQVNNQVANIQAAGPSVNGYGLQQNIDHPNSAVVGNTTSNDPNVCAQACDANPQCNGFIQATDNPYCWLTSSMTAGTPSASRNTYVMSRPNPALAAQQAAATSQNQAMSVTYPIGTQGMDYYGNATLQNNYLNGPNANPNNCSAMCNKDPTCKGFLYGAKNQECFFKTGFPNGTPNPDRVQYLKPSGPIAPVPVPAPVASMGASLAAVPTSSAEPAGLMWQAVYSNQNPPIDIGESATNAAFKQTMVFKRTCTDCVPAYATVYYKRITPIPANVSIYSLMKNLWSSQGNLLGVDFNLYSTYSDLISGKNAWPSCNYDDTANQVAGFRDCAPSSGGSAFQWNSAAPGWPQQNSRHVTYYVLQPSAAPAPMFAPAPAPMFAPVPAPMSSSGPAPIHHNTYHDEFSAKTTEHCLETLRKCVLPHLTAVPLRRLPCLARLIIRLMEERRLASLHRLDQIL